MSRTDVLLALVLAGAMAWMGAWRVGMGPIGLHHDDAIYVSTAKALAEGQGYRLIDLPGSPPQTKYPVLYPALLALAWKIRPDFPGNAALLEGISMAAGMLAVGLGYLYLRRFGYASRAQGFAAGLLAAGSLPFLHLSGTAMSETPFAAALVLSLWAVEAVLERGEEASGWSLFLAGMASALPFHVRLAGALLPLAGACGLRRSPRRLGWFLAGAAAAVAPWPAWLLLCKAAGAGAEDSIARYYESYGGWFLAFDPWVILKMAMHNVSVIAGLTGQQTLNGLTGLVSRHGLIGAAETAWGLAGAAATGLLLIDAARTRRLLPLALASCLGLAAAWPWPPERFVIPLLPLLCVYLARAPEWLLGRAAGSRALRIAGLAFVMAAFAANALLNAENRRTSESLGYPSSGMEEEPPAKASYEDVFAWVREHTRPDDIIATTLDGMLFLYTGRQAYRPYVPDPATEAFGTKDQNRAEADAIMPGLALRKPRYVISMPMPGWGETKPFDELLARLETERPDLLVPVHVGTDRRFRIYEARF